MSYLEDHYPGYDCDTEGNIYRDGVLITPFKSNKYLQVVMFRDDGSSSAYGVHTVVAMKYLNYFKGCVVHHKDNNTHNNSLVNLEVFSRSEHARLHSKENVAFMTHNLGKPAWNKGLKMSEEFCNKCSISAKMRKQKFGGNQYVDANRNPR